MCPGDGDDMADDDAGVEAKAPDQPLDDSPERQMIESKGNHDSDRSGGGEQKEA